LKCEHCELPTSDPRWIKYNLSEAQRDYIRAKIICLPCCKAALTRIGLKQMNIVLHTVPNTVMNLTISLEQDNG